MANPASPPHPAINALWVSTCRAMRPRPAPTASRTASSRCRDEDRAINKFARLAHATIRRSATPAIKIDSD